MVGGLQHVLVQQRSGVQHTACLQLEVEEIQETVNPIYLFIYLFICLIATEDNKYCPNIYHDVCICSDGDLKILIDLL